MEIKVSQHAGFCFGVKRAMELIEKAKKDGKKIYTLGPIIHNPQVVAKLEKEGVGVINDGDSIEDGSVVVIRSHGITKEAEENLRKKNVEVLDSTCPFVKNAQKKAEELYKQGYSVYIYGEKEHPEVKAILSYTDYKGVVISSPEQIKDVKKKIGIVSQTTRNKKGFANVCSAIIEKGYEVCIYNTICDATFLRQEDAIAIASDSDFAIVIGGKNSANTTKLYEIVKEITEAVHIETADELDFEQLKKYKRIGVTAGASTPDFIIDDVKRKIKNIGG